jgi:hypothetical protein
MVTLTDALRFDRASDVRVDAPRAKVDAKRRACLSTDGLCALSHCHLIERAPNNHRIHPARRECLAQNNEYSDVTSPAVRVWRKSCHT